MMRNVAVRNSDQRWPDVGRDIIDSLSRSYHAGAMIELLLLQNQEILIKIFRR